MTYSCRAFRRWTCRRKHWSTSCLWRLVSALDSIQAAAELIKGSVSGGSRKWKKQAVGVRIPDRKRGSRLLPYSGPDEEGTEGTPLRSSVKNTTVNKGNSWEVLIITFQTPDRVPAHKNYSSTEQRFEKQTLIIFHKETRRKAKTPLTAALYKQTLRFINERPTCTVSPLWTSCSRTRNSVGNGPSTHRSITPHPTLPHSLFPVWQWIPVRQQREDPPVPAAQAALPEVHLRRAAPLQNRQKVRSLTSPMHPRVRRSSWVGGECLNTGVCGVTSPFTPSDCLKGASLVLIYSLRRLQLQISLFSPFSTSCWLLLHFPWNWNLRRNTFKEPLKEAGSPFTGPRRSRSASEPSRPRCNSDRPSKGAGRRITTALKNLKSSTDPVSRGEFCCGISLFWSSGVGPFHTPGDWCPDRNTKERLGHAGRVFPNLAEECRFT